MVPYFVSFVGNHGAVIYLVALLGEVSYEWVYTVTISRCSFRGIRHKEKYLRHARK